MKKILLFSILFIAITIAVVSQTHNYTFRLYLSDKGIAAHSIDKPEKFLSLKSIERRKRQGIAINNSDLPIADNYIKAVENIGGTVVAKSKWMQTITVHCPDSSYIELYKQLPFVNSAKLVWKGAYKPTDSKNYIAYDDSLLKTRTTLPHHLDIETDKEGAIYGKATKNVSTQNGQYLHQAGYLGKGINIAVIDAGFENLYKMPYLKDANIEGFKNFTHHSGSLFEENGQHGLNVLSCMATNLPYLYVGTAPEANYYLLMSEDGKSEYPVEEDYWATAIEYADSIGVDVVNTSLGYSKFDDASMNFKKEDLNGNTHMISRAASMGASKGIFIVCSAGNEGNKKWRTLTSPADAAQTLTVGAIRSDSIISSFSSLGFTSDMRIKPDVVALGDSVSIVDSSGAILKKNGTSFSAPIITGLVACLWQAYPSLSAKELYRVMVQSAHNFDYPDPAFGYGIPDMKKAMQLAETVVATKNIEIKKIVTKIKKR